ncbi:MAG: hypothetical protein V9H25_02260 [Candidatus Competibacter sp.]
MTRFIGISPVRSRYRAPPSRHLDLKPAIAGYQASKWPLSHAPDAWEHENIAVERTGKLAVQ